MVSNRTDYDLIVIGGGINGAGIARDAAGRGLSTLLVESGDLAGATSSASTKLIHGGLRYLEYYDFKLVAESLRERERLLRVAPHIIWPLKFILPHEPHLRPAWMIRAGLFLYDHLGGRRSLKRSRAIHFTADGPLKAHFERGFSYADCWVDDARLVVLNALDATERGAQVMTRTRCETLRADDDIWRVTLKSSSGPAVEKTARMVVNATGPWARRFLDDNNLAHDTTPNVRLVRGSHIVIPRLYEGSQAYILQQQDRRIVFAIPYEGRFTLIGTTDAEHNADPAAPRITDDETSYLCAAINNYFKRQITPSDIVWTYSGVRPLLEEPAANGGKVNASAATRDYRLVTDRTHGPLLLSVFGGKITTFRHLAEEAVNHLTPEKPWTGRVPLPGGDLPHHNFDTYARIAAAEWPWLPDGLRLRLARAYGTRMGDVLGPTRGITDLGAYYGDDWYECELRYLVEYEWARTADDVLWRRSKQGLHVTPQTAAAIAAAMPAIVKEHTGT
jgi:glycerol-3-phosphate dehydrogenase